MLYGFVITMVFISLKDAMRVRRTASLSTQGREYKGSCEKWWPSCASRMASLRAAAWDTSMRLSGLYQSLTQPITQRSRLSPKSKLKPLMISCQTRKRHIRHHPNQTLGKSRSQRNSISVCKDSHIYLIFIAAVLPCDFRLILLYSFHMLCMSLLQM